jgi:hypothetical protein
MTTTHFERDRRGRFIKATPPVKIKVYIDHTYSEEFLGLMTVQEFKTMSKKSGGQFITSTI